MQSHGRLRGPLRIILKSIGGPQPQFYNPPRRYASSSTALAPPTSTATQDAKPRSSIGMPYTTISDKGKPGSDVHTTTQYGNDTQQTNVIRKHEIQPKLIRKHELRPEIIHKHEVPPKMVRKCIPRGPDGNNMVEASPIQRVEDKREREAVPPTNKHRESQGFHKDGDVVDRADANVSALGRKGSVDENGQIKISRRLLSRALRDSEHRATGTDSANASLSFPGRKGFVEEDGQLKISRRLLSGAPRPSLHRVVGTDSANYKRAYEHSRRRGELQQAWRERTQLARHKYQDDDWLPVLDLLDRATLSGTSTHAKRMETVFLVDGLRALFKGNTGATLLELMHLTGSHVQVLPMYESTGVGFGALTMWGTPSQNSEALDLLPSKLMGFSPDDSMSIKDIERKMLDAKVTDMFGTVIDETKYAVQSSLNVQESSSLEDQKEEDIWQADLEAAFGEAPFANASPTARSYWSRPPPRQLTAEERLRRRPTDWTSLRFADYVDTLTEPAPRLQRRKSEAAVKPFKDAIIDELRTLFIDEPGLQRYMSSEAVDSAFAFLVRHREFPILRHTGATLQDSSEYSLTSSNYEKLLGAAALIGDLHNFRVILKQMLQSRLRPTWRSWARFHGLVCLRFAPADAVKVVELMRDKGLFAEPKAVREVAANMIEPFMLEVVEDSTFTLDKTFKTMNAVFGVHLSQSSIKENSSKGWLTPDSATKMITLLLSVGRQREALTIVSRLYEAGEKIQAPVVNCFLTSKLRARDMTGAIAILQHFHDLPIRPSQRIRLNGISFALLFRLAYTKEMYNTMRVLWQYACASGHVHSSMENLVRKSLFSPFPPLMRRFLESNTDDTQTANPDNLYDATDVSRSSVVTRGVLRSGFTGKFVIGLSQGLTPRRGEDVERTYDETVLAMRARHQPWSLTPSENTILAFAQEPPPPSRAKRKLAGSSQNYHMLKQFIHADIAEYKSLAPVPPFLDMIRKAWELDTAMRLAKLDVLPEKLRMYEGGNSEQMNEKLRQSMCDTLRDLLAWGIHVPMRVVGNKTAVRKGDERFEIAL